MRRGRLLLVSVALIGCSRKPVAIDAEARALGDAVDVPSIPSDSAPTVPCPVTRIIVSRDAIHVTNAPAFAALAPEKREALRAQANEDERYGLPLLARNVVRIANGAASGAGGHVLGPLRPVLEFARQTAEKLVERDDYRWEGVEILADKSTPMGLFFDVANTAAFAGLKPSIRVRDGGGMSCTTLLVASRRRSELRRGEFAAVRVERDGASLRGCRVLSEPMCAPLGKMLATIGGREDPCEPAIEGDDTITLLESPDDLSLGDLLGAFDDVRFGARSFVLALPGSQAVESFRSKKCHAP